LERLLEAGAELLQERGFEGFTLAEVARRASVSVSSIYARTASKEGLILAIYEREVARIVTDQEALDDVARWEGCSTRWVVEGAVREMAAGILRNGAMLRVFVNRAALDPEFCRLGSENSVRLGERFQSLLLLRRVELCGPDVEETVDFCFRVVYAALFQRITYGPTFESPRPLSDEALVDWLSLRAVALLVPADR
jgi:AcrR family transcriptional regulator